MAKTDRILTDIIAEGNRLGKKAIWNLYNNKKTENL